MVKNMHIKQNQNNTISNVAIKKIILKNHNKNLHIMYCSTWLKKHSNNSLQITK